MKKKLVTAAVSLALTLGVSALAASNPIFLKNTNTYANLPVSDNKVPEQSAAEASSGQATNEANSQLQVQSAKEEEDASIIAVQPTEKEADTAAKENSKSKQPLSRGGNVLPQQSTTYTSTPKYGELISWSNVNQLIPRGTTIKVKDIGTGKIFNIKRTFGTNHLDGEALSISDTNLIKSIWGGFSWERRPVIVIMDGRSIAASMTAMPHAGVDSAPAAATVKNRSGGYGTGENLDAVKNNGMDGVIDIHFLNSKRHKDGKSDPQHQAAILKAAGK